MFDMMNEELRQPGTARARDCQAVRAGVWRVTGGMDILGHRKKSSSTMCHRRGCHRRQPCKQHGQSRRVRATRDHVLNTVRVLSLARWCAQCREVAGACAHPLLLGRLNEDIE